MMGDSRLETDLQRLIMINMFGLECSVAMKALSQEDMIGGQRLDTRESFGGSEIALKTFQSLAHQICRVRLTLALLQTSPQSGCPHHPIAAFTIDHTKSPTSASS